MANIVDINGVPFYFTDAHLVLNGTQYEIASLSAIDYGSKVDRKPIHGPGALPLDISDGPVTFDNISITLNLITWENIKAQVGLPNLQGSAYMAWTLTLVKSDGSALLGITFTGKYVSDKTSAKVGTDGIMATVNIMPIAIDTNLEF